MTPENAPYRIGNIFSPKKDYQPYDTLHSALIAADKIAAKEPMSTIGVFDSFGQIVRLFVLGQRFARL